MPGYKNAPVKARKGAYEMQYTAHFESNVSVPLLNSIFIHGTIFEYNCSFISLSYANIAACNDMDEHT